MDDDVPELLTVYEVASMLRVSKMTVYRLVHSGEFEAVRVGRLFRIPQTSVTSLLDDQELLGRPHTPSVSGVAALTFETGGRDDGLIE